MKNFNTLISEEYQKLYNPSRIPTKRIAIKYVPELCPFYLKDPNKFKKAPKYYLCHYDKKSDTAYYCLNDNEYTTYGSKIVYGCANMY